MALTTNIPTEDELFIPVDELTVTAFPPYDGAQDYDDDAHTPVMQGIAALYAKPFHLVRPAPKTIDSKEANRFARHEVQHPSIDWYRWCLKFVRTAWGLPMKYATARDAWENGTQVAYTGNPNDIPFGAPVFSKARNAGPDDSWHVFLAGGFFPKRQDRLFRSTDIVAHGRISPVPIQAFIDRWDHEILGWTRDLNGQTLNLPKPPRQRRK